MYMTVSGAPVKKARHAEPISAMALDMLEAVTLLKNPANKKPMTVTIGKLRHFPCRGILRECCTLVSEIPFQTAEGFIGSLER